MTRAAVDILPEIPGVDFDAGWDRRVEGLIDAKTGFRAFFISRDDLIASKLASVEPAILQTLKTSARRRRVCVRRRTNRKRAALANRPAATQISERASSSVAVLPVTRVSSLYQSTGAFRYILVRPMHSKLEEIISVTRERVAAARVSADLRALTAAAERHHPRGFRQSLRRVAASASPSSQN